MTKFKTCLRLFKNGIKTLLHDRRGCDRQKSTGQEFSTNRYFSKESTYTFSYIWANLCSLPKLFWSPKAMCQVALHSQSQPPGS